MYKLSYKILIEYIKVEQKSIQNLKMEVALKKVLLLLLILTLISLPMLVSCKPNEVHYAPEEYILNMEYKADFRILQLTDLHFSAKDNKPIHYNFLRNLVNEANPDLIVVTGDIFTFAGRMLRILQVISYQGNG